MKYGIWTSTPNNNTKLDKLFKETLKEGGRIVLFFRVAVENVLCGVAELTSQYIPEQQFDFWWNKIKWNGIFNLRWLYVKNLDLNSISKKQDGRRLYELTDGSQLNKDNGFFLLDMFKHITFKYEFSILKFFVLFDQREDYLRGVRCKMDVQIKLQKRVPKSEKKNEIKRRGSRQFNIKEGKKGMLDKRRATIHHFGTEKRKEKEKEEKRSRRFSYYVEPTEEEWEDLGYVQTDKEVEQYIRK